jgi:hypothetical protein
MLREEGSGSDSELSIPLLDFVLMILGEEIWTALSALVVRMT